MGGRSGAGGGKGGGGASPEARLKGVAAGLSIVADFAQNTTDANLTDSRRASLSDKIGRLHASTRDTGRSVDVAEVTGRLRGSPTAQTIRDAVPAIQGLRADILSQATGPRRSN